LSDIPLDQAQDIFFKAIKDLDILNPCNEETLLITETLGRVTSKPVWAEESSPAFDSAAMDGVAVHSDTTANATETNPVSLLMGSQALWVDTGDPMPIGYNAVVMIENIIQVNEDLIRITAPVAPWQHVRPLGEDIVATELILPQSHEMTPVDQAACAAAGLNKLTVLSKPSVAIIVTGNELVPAGSTLKRGDIIDSNSILLSGLVTSWGGICHIFDPVPDDHNRILACVKLALNTYDCVIVNAGSSAGKEDHTANVIAELGKVLVHGVAIRPGHPVILGIAKNKPIWGLPGYPVSASLTAELFVKPIIDSITRRTHKSEPSYIKAQITQKVSSSMGEDEFLRVTLGQVGDRVVATPLQRGAGIIMSLVKSDGYVKIPRYSEGLDAGSEINVTLKTDITAIYNTIVCIGSHDLALDLIGNYLRNTAPRIRFSSAHVGSLGGLRAVQRLEAHLAGCHLLDPNTGEYNVSYIEHYLPNTRTKLINLVGRVQGLMVPRGNPNNIHTLEDLTRSDVYFANRQRGSGTRVLLDYKLHQMQIPTSSIKGYSREEYTHLSVAAAVSGGSVDTGLGILSAATALNLDFIPVASERYDLVIPTDHYESELLQPLLGLINDKTFHESVNTLGGYDVSNMGHIIADFN
jgi:putative molybdopterin biosynthesis protein